MKQNKAFKFRIYPTSEQEILIQKTFGCCRFIWNKMLADKIEAYQNDGIDIKTYPAFYKKEFPWLSEIDSHALGNEQLNLQRAYTAFFKKRSKFPKFKSKKGGKKSYTTNNCNNAIRVVNNKLMLPKLGLMKIKFHRQIPLDYKLKSITISQTATGKYYVSILTEYEFEQSKLELNKENSLGLDYSSHDFYVDNEGNKANYPKFFRKYEQQLAKEQRKLSRMKLNSANYKKQKVKVAKIYEKIANSRKDFLHKLSYQLAEKYDYICIEDLNLKSIAQFGHLGKSTMDNGFGMFRSYLQYKLFDRGKQLLKLPRFEPSSIVCSCCGAYHKDIVNSLSIREWTCPDCGTHHDRDINAAINIRQFSLQTL